MTEGKKKKKRRREEPGAKKAENNKRTLSEMLRSENERTSERANKEDEKRKQITIYWV